MITNGQDHLTMRKHIYRNLEPFPSPHISKRYFDYIMAFVGLFAPIALIPQAFEIYSSHQAHNFTLSTWVVLGTINFLWGVYGIFHKEPPIYVANFCSSLLNFTIAFGVILYH